VFRPIPMKKFYLTIYTEKEEETIEAIGREGLAQLTCEYCVGAPSRAEELEIFEHYGGLTEKVKSLPLLEPSEKERKSFKNVLWNMFKREGRTQKVPEVRLNTEEIGAYLAETELKIGNVARLKELGEEIAGLKKFLVLEENGIALGTLGNYKHVFVKAGFLNKKLLTKFSEYMQGINVAYDFKPFSTTNEFAVIAGPIEKLTEVEEALTNFNFDELKPPEAAKAVGISEQIAEKEKEAKALKAMLLETVEEFSQRSAELDPIIRTTMKLDKARSGISRTGSFSVIQGWIPKDNMKDFRSTVKKTVGEKFVLEIKNPTAKDKPPIVIRSHGVIKYFDPIIRIRGMPDYNEINPAPIITILFLAMFGMMFGDIGEGVLFIIMGYVLTKKKSEMLQKIGGLLALCGVSASIFGLMYGSVFLAEVIRPILFRPLTDVMLIIKIAFYFGIAQITLGMVLNIANKAIQKDRFDLLGGGHGIAGLSFYLSFISLVLLSNLKIGAVLGFPLLLAVMLGALAVVVVTPVLKSYAKKEKLSHGAFEGVRELFEVPITLLANSVSYLRIAALALIHGAFALLAASFTVGLGTISAVLVYVMLNALVLALEGLIAAIQTLRLIYYEFSTKFYSGTGTAYVPFET
jgi:V/A-type H+-transporting ATPase subunit I